jgi:hypothetical protein
MSERPSANYQCQNLGCPNGHLSTFTGAPPEWFIQKGMTPPKGCPDCRAWIKSQTDSASRCSSCGYGIRQPARYKISFHKRSGPYKAPTVCRQCEEGKVAEKQTGRKRKELSIDDVPPLQPTQNQALSVVSYDSLSGARKGHYGKHIPGHPFAEVGRPGKHGAAVSPTTLVSEGATTHRLYLAGKEIAERTDGSVYQYNQGDSVLKVTIVDRTHAEITVFRRVGAMYELITSYDGVAIASVKAKYEDKS